MTTPDHRLDRATTERVSLDLVRLVKLLKAVRQHAPRMHPAVDTMAYPVLFNLAHEERRVSALAECVHSDISTTSRQVSSLVSHGLLEKVSDPEDGRAQVVRLSPAGHDLLARIQEQRSAWFEQLLEGWTAQEASQFADHLERFTAALERSHLSSPTSTTSTTEH
ncbi:MarR family winged helix-turn-helix transcriptional regulator [Pedococcus sp. NPDC057267]|uniref:MarR family winged helix-turn-helix transcriptional regulator n=1 Tax=Pedococcus sp. NPDC057267 TaxID=3346077 RepID=UPI003636321F